MFGFDLEFALYFSLFSFLFSVFDLFLSMYVTFNDIIFNTGIFGFSFGDILLLVPDKVQNTFFFYLERLGIITSVNLMVLFLGIKASIRLIPFVGRMF